LETVLCKRSFPIYFLGLQGGLFCSGLALLFFPRSKFPITLHYFLNFVMCIICLAGLHTYGLRQFQRKRSCGRHHGEFGPLGYCR
jgi:hypothetical protein